MSKKKKWNKLVKTNDCVDKTSGVAGCRVAFSTFTAIYSVHMRIKWHTDSHPKRCLFTRTKANKKRKTKTKQDKIKPNKTENSVRIKF